MESNYSEILLLVDMDDTIIDLLSAWVNWNNTRYVTNVRTEDITNWDIMKFFPGFSKKVIYSPLYIDDFWKTVKPIKDSQIYLKTLIDDGFNLYICTSSNYYTIKTKLSSVLGNYFPFIPWSKVITISEKQLLNADILIDDGVHNLIGGNYDKILMTAPHNKEYDASANGMLRANNWAEGYNQIIKCANRILDKRYGD